MSSRQQLVQIDSFDLDLVTVDLEIQMSVLSRRRVQQHPFQLTAWSISPRPAES